MPARRIGIDLGGTKTEVVVLGENGAELLRRRVPTPAGDYEAIVATIAMLAREAEGVAGRGATIGVGTPGSISRERGTMINANSTVLIGKPFKADVERRIGRPVRMANDANCLAISEASDGAGAHARVVFAVILGTGVGGALAIEKRVIDGANGIAGEWGHNPLPWPQTGELPGPACYCGKRGCIETFVSGPALARDREAHGDDAAMARYEDRLARSLATVINVVDPDVIVLGGGVSNIQRLYSNVPRLLDHYVFSDAVRTTLARAIHGDSSGVRGAAMLWAEGE
ncbi:MAG TPA: ROK family protein [Candidatus Baltobacteraceae bacterium]|nr:ROK family protein [Candidatus Baltobacteraceae bacterium]